MGMYTELVLGVELRAETPDNVIDILRYMISESDVKPELPSHELFETDRWPIMLTCDSYYFDGLPHAALEFDDIGEAYYLTVRSNFKNYGNEVEKFMDFIQPYLDTRGFLGYTIYEEDGDPTLIYNTSNGIRYEVHGNRDCTYFY